MQREEQISIMEKVSRLARRFFAFGAGSSMALVFAVIFLNAVRRYTLGKSIAWGEELPIYLTIYGVMFGLAYAYMTDGHIRFTILIDTLAEKTRAYLFLFCDAVSILVGLVLIQAGHNFAVRRGHLDSSGLKSAGDWLADVTGLPFLEWIGKVGTWQYAIVLGGALLAVAASIRLIERYSDLRRLDADDATGEGVS